MQAVLLSSDCTTACTPTIELCRVSNLFLAAIRGDLYKDAMPNRALI